MRSSASARPARSPTCPRTRPSARSKRSAVIGAGTMGGGISMNFLNAGIPVTMLEMKQEALDRGVATIRKNYEGQVKKGKLKQDKYDQRMASAEDHAQLRRHQGRRHRDRGGVRGDGRQGKGVQEARRGDEARRHPRQQHLHARRRTRSPPFTKRPQDVIGTHFFSPANVMKLLEVVRGEQDREGRAGHRDGAWARRSRRPRWSPASATASSATA